MSPHEKFRARAFRRRLLVATPWALLPILCTCTGPSPDTLDTEAEIAERPNIVLVVVDTLRADRLGADRGGEPVMPGLREFAAGSRSFSSATSPSPWTKPAMVSVFTSLYPDVHRVHYLVANEVLEGSVRTDVLPGNMETLAGFLRAHGYETAAVQSNANLVKIGLEKGFDNYFFEGYPGFSADRVTDKALELLAQLPEPFFLYVHYMDPHGPYNPPERYRQLFGPLPEVSSTERKRIAEWSEYYLDRVLHDVGLNAERSHVDLSAAARESLRILYDGEVRFVDDEISRLLEHLGRVHPDSLIIVTADHGEEHWEHGSIGHGKTLFEELVHVPLLLRAPAIVPGIVGIPVQTIDIAPTIAAYAGLALRTHWQGRPLATPPLPADAERPIFAETRTSMRAAAKDMQAVRVGRFKYIEYRHSGERFLFDLGRDPGEELNLIGRRPELADELAEHLTDYRQTNASHPSLNLQQDEVELSREIGEILGAVGYLE